MKRLTVFLLLALVACTEGNPSAPALPATFGVAPSDELAVMADTHIVVPPLRITPSATAIRVNWAWTPRHAFTFSIEREDDGEGDWRDISNSLPLDADPVSWSDVQEVCYRSVSQVGDATQTSVLRVCTRTPETIVVPALHLTPSAGAVAVRWDTPPTIAFTFSIQRENDGDGVWDEVSTSLPIVDLVSWSERVEVCYRSVSQVGGGVAQTSDPPVCTGTSAAIVVPNLTARALLDTRRGSSTMVEVDWVTAPSPAFTFSILRADGTTATSLPFRDEVDWSTTLEVCYQATASNDSTSNSVCVTSPISFVMPTLGATTQAISTDGTLASAVNVDWVSLPTDFVPFAFSVERYDDGVVSPTTWSSLPITDTVDWSETLEACYQATASDGMISNPACVTMPFVMPPLTATADLDVITVDWESDPPSFSSYKVQVLDVGGEWVNASTSLPFSDSIGLAATGCYQVIADVPAGFTSPMVCATTGSATGANPR